MTEIHQSEAASPAAGEPTEGVAEAEGATVDDAVEAALRELGLERSEAAVEVLAEGSAPLSGERLAVAAQVRVRRLDERTARGRQLLSELLALMGIPARVVVRPAPSPVEGGAPPPAILDVFGDDLGLLIGWRGETLRAIQTVLNLMMGDGREGERRLILDIERYRARREDQVRELARRMAERVRRSGQRQLLDPMHGYERRAVHVALEAEPGVRTESVGREPARRVVIHPEPPTASGAS